MNKRLVLAIAISFIFLLSWSMLTSKLYHFDNKEVITQAPPQIIPAALTPPVNQAQSAENEISNLSTFRFDQDNLEVTFVESYASIKEVKFKAYQDYQMPLKHAFLFGSNSLQFKKVSASKDQVVFVYRDNNKEITKRFIFSNNKYDMWLEIEVRNLSSDIINIDMPLWLGSLDNTPDKNHQAFQAISVVSLDKTLHLSGPKDVNLTAVKFMGIREKYFCSIIEPEKIFNYNGWIKKLTSHEAEVALQVNEMNLEPGQKQVRKFRIYLGPQELKILNAADPNWSIIMNYGFFNIVAHFLLHTLSFIFGIVHNWGLAIVILSVLIYFIFYPLTLKQMNSMKQMQALQPKIVALRETYKNNPQKLNKEVMELYREHKVNPLGGCLPMLLQLPVFFALYQALIRSVALKGAHFLWIKDLSEPDRLFTLPTSLPFLGNELNILPLIMAVEMFFQQKLSMASTAGTGSAEQQKIMLIIFPIMFGFIFYHMPSGIVLYWFVNSALTLTYQIRAVRLK